MVVCGAIYHLVSQDHGPVVSRGYGSFPFLTTFIGSYLVFLPMHYLGIMGVPRRYFEITGTTFLPDSAQSVNESITIAAFVSCADCLHLQSDRQCHNGKKAPIIRGMRRHLSGKQKPRHRDTAILVKSCHAFIGGPMTIVFPGLGRTSFLRTCLPEAQAGGSA